MIVIVRFVDIGGIVDHHCCTTSSTSLKSMLCLGCNTLMTDIKELAYDNVLYLAPPPKKIILGNLDSII
jgi:hypothetical protein